MHRITRPFTRRRFAGALLVSGLAVVVSVSGCSSTSGTSSGGRAERAQAAAHAKAMAAIPAVEGATDLTSKPTIKPGAAAPPTTLQTRDLITGSGRAATSADTVSVRYVGVNYTDGKEFDSSWSNQQGSSPVSFSLTGVVPGFAQGIEGMKVGGRREIVIPPSLGYGAQGSPPQIAPNETLVFVVDLVGIS